MPDLTLVKVKTRREYVVAVEDVFHATNIENIQDLQPFWNGEEVVESISPQDVAPYDEPDFDVKGFPTNNDAEYVIPFASYVTEEGDGYQTIETLVLTMHDDDRSVCAGFETCDAVAVGQEYSFVSAEYVSQIPGAHYAVWKVTWNLVITVTEGQQ